MSQICLELHQLFNASPRYTFPFDKSGISFSGIYIVFEQGESGHGMDRIVRIGTSDTLGGRLKGHFVTGNKDGSILRKHIGRALLNKDNNPFLDQWNWVSSKEKRGKHKDDIDGNKKKLVEEQVTEYIQNHLSVVVFGVDDKERRLDLESKIISTISWCEECSPSENWLGLHSPDAQKKIRMSGLWNIQKLYKQSLSETDFAELKKLVQP